MKKKTRSKKIDSHSSTMLLIILLLLFVFFMGISVFENNTTGNAHSVYPAFQEPMPDNTVVSDFAVATDDIIYHIGKYSIDGATWQDFQLVGTYFRDSTTWLSSTASGNLPGFGDGEHYVIIYSCSLAGQGTTQNPLYWDCHDDKWQLHIIYNPWCGDGTCDDDEHCGNCPTDCACGDGRVCSNNRCVTATCSGSSTQTCSISHGSCIQSRTCNAGTWSSWGSCNQNCQCSDGYKLQGASTCVVDNCGNGVCNTDENCGSCPGDCLCAPGYVCGGSTCSLATDCGDGVCSTVENCGTCTLDCLCNIRASCVNGVCVANN